MDSQGFLPRLDHFKTTAEKLFHGCNDSEPNAAPGVFGRAWLRGFLDRHPAVSARSLHPGPSVCICEPFWPYKGLLQKAKAAIAKCRIQEEEDMDEKGLSSAQQTGQRLLHAQLGGLQGQHYGTREFMERKRQGCRTQHHLGHLSRTDTTPPPRIKNGVETPKFVQLLPNLKTKPTTPRQKIQQPNCL